MNQIFELSNERGKPFEYLFFKLIAIKFLIYFRLLMPPFHQKSQHVVEAPEMIMMCMSDKDFTDPHCLLLIVHESREVFKKQLVLLWVVP